MTIELLQQVRVLDPLTETDRIADVLIEHGRIRTIAASITDYPSDAVVYSCSGQVLGPGLVDLYSHSGEPGFEERETVLSLLQAGAAGGFTRLTILPDTLPPLDDLGSLAWVQNHWRQQIELQSLPTAHLPRLLCWAALTQGAAGQQMTELAELATAEIAGFADGKSIGNWQLLRRILEYGQPLGKPIALWANDTALAGNGVMREGEASMRFGLPGVPTMAETAALAALLECIESIGTPVHLMRISTARGVELVRQAKARGVPVTASTSWMHLLLNSDDVGSYDPSLRLEPPLGNPIDQSALNRAVREGVIDAIAVDHTPYTYEEKTVAFAEAPPGAIGLELALPILWTRLVKTGAWSALELWRSLSSQPSICLKQKPTSLTPGSAAELTLFDPAATWTVEPLSLKSQSQNTTWLGQILTGRVIRIWQPAIAP